MPYSGPLAPPTLLTSVMPTSLNSSSAVAGGRVVELVEHRLHPAVHVDAVVGVADGRVELGELAPVLRDRARRTDGPTPRGWATVTAFVAIAQTPHRSAGVRTGASHRPDQLVVQLEQRDRAAGHLERGDVRADERAGDRDAVAVEDPRDLAEHHVQLEQRCAAHAVDEGQHRVAALEGQVAHDRLEQALGDLRRGAERLAEAAGLAVDADADLDLVSPSSNVGLPAAGTVQEVSAMPMLRPQPVDLAADGGDRGEILPRPRRRRRTASRPAR